MFSFFFSVYPFASKGNQKDGGKEFTIAEGTMYYKFRQEDILENVQAIAFSSSVL